MRTHRRAITATLLAASALLGWLTTSGRIDVPLALGQETAKPNIVFILMDNLGYGEVGVYGGGITPRYANASHRQARDGGHETAQLQRRGTMYAEPFGHHDRALFHAFRHALDPDRWRA